MASISKVNKDFAPRSKICVLVIKDEITEKVTLDQFSL